jgi:DNA-binding SARP family transcriptional activator
VAAQLLEIRVVGPLRVRIDGAWLREDDPRWSRRAAIELLRALALAGGRLSREEAIAALWPQATFERAQGSLRVTLHALRRALEPDGEGAGRFIDYDGAYVSLRAGIGLAVDAHEAERALRRATLARAAHHTTEALAIYARAIELLGAVRREDAVPAWLRPHVRQWRRLLCLALRAGAELSKAAGDVDAAGWYVTRALDIEPLDEATVALALDIALANGDVERAREHFLEHKRRLGTELGVAPSAGLAAKYAAVLRSRAKCKSEQLTAQDIEILTLVGRGEGSKQIAAELGTSSRRIDSQVGRILRKMGVASRAAAVAAAGALLEA